MVKTQKWGRDFSHHRLSHILKKPTKITVKETKRKEKNSADTRKPQPSACKAEPQNTKKFSFSQSELKKEREDGWQDRHIPDFRYYFLPELPALPCRP